MILAVGLGCQRGCSVDALLELFNAALAEGGIERQRVTALASLDLKQDEPGYLSWQRFWSCLWWFSVRRNWRPMKID